MPVLTSETAVEGQSKEYTIDTGKDLSEATVTRIYYKINGTEGYWDDGDGVEVVDTTKLRYTHHNLPVGNISLVPHCEWADGFVSRSPDPVVFKVRPLYS